MRSWLKLAQSKVAIILVGVIIADQASKILAIKFALPHVLNSGAWFGLWPETSFYLILISVVILLILAFSLKISRTVDQLLGLSLILAGGISNLLDRVRTGNVIDFIKFGPIPSFNLADLAIFLGIILIIVPISKKATKTIAKKTAKIERTSQS